MLVECYEAGLGDAILVDLYTAHSLQARGSGVMSDNLTKLAGPVPNSVYYCRRDRVDELSDRIGRMLIGVQKAMDQVMTTTVPNLLEVGTQTLPPRDPEVLKSVIDYLLDTKTWESTRIPRQSYERWVAFQHDVPLLPEVIPFEDLIDTRARDMATPPESPEGASSAASG